MAHGVEHGRESPERQTTRKKQGVCVRKFENLRFWMVYQNCSIPSPGGEVRVKTTKRHRGRAGERPSLTIQDCGA